MATPEGSVFFEAGGKRRSLRFTTNALCLAEEHLGKRTIEIATELEIGVSMQTLRALFWAATDDRSITLAQAGDLIDEVSVASARKLAMDAFSAAFPDAEADDRSDANPPKVGDGSTGTADGARQASTQTTSGT